MVEAIDISAYVIGVDFATEPDFATLTTTMPGLRSLGPITITGRWDSPDEALADLAVRVAFAGRRAPRKSKKALRKAWLGRDLTPRERQRISRLTLTTL